MIPREEQARLTNEVRKLLNNGYSEDYIIEKLRISERSFYRYKNRVIRDIIEAFKPNPQEVEYQYAMVRKSLEDYYRINKQIMEDPKVSAKDRSKAAEMTCIARAQLCKLAEKGPFSVAYYLGKSESV